MEALEERAEQGIAALGQHVQEAGPFLAEELVGELLRFGDIAQGQKDVVALLEVDMLAA
jgi:hypothetical protein